MSDHCIYKKFCLFGYVIEIRFSLMVKRKSKTKMTDLIGVWKEVK